VTTIDNICIAIIILPFLLASPFIILMTMDGILYSWPRYRKFMYGNFERDEEGKFILIGQITLMLGVSSVVFPSIIIGIYLYYTDMPLELITKLMIERLI